ncbi:MAG: DsbA family oxidoreductase [Phormidesmis sp.]
MALTIYMTSDFICPWCWVAKSRVDQAIEQLDFSVDVERVWLPFELNPDMPAEGIDRQLYRSTKFGSWAHSQQLDAQTVQATQADEVEFHYEKIKVTPNTFNAHRLTWLAGKSGLATEMGDRILRAYFSEGQDIGQAATLSALAGEIGLETEAVSRFLSSNAGVEEVRRLEKQAISQGIRGVPSIRIGNTTISGAQSVGTLVAALKRETA